MTGIIVSEKIQKEAKKKLSALSDVFFLSPDDSVEYPVSTHPDMIMCILGRNAVLPSEYAEKNPHLVDFLERKLYNVIFSDEKRSPGYPHETGLNCAVGDDYIITRQKSTDKNILSLAERNGYRIINVKQGYAGCSALVCDNTVITSDRGISSALSAYGIYSVYVSNDGIVLPGYDVGFIGGCGGYYNKSLYLFGNIDTAECGNALKKHASENGFDIISLCDGLLTDYGGIKFLK